ncbi:MAG: hypothetical protein ACRDOO_11800 [Actinomadura sp.]
MTNKTFAADKVLAALHAADFLRLPADGAISAAYPFSTVATPHMVLSAGLIRGSQLCHSVSSLDLPDGVDPVRPDFETDDPTDGRACGKVMAGRAAVVRFW